MEQMCHADQVRFLLLSNFLHSYNSNNTCLALITNHEPDDEQGWSEKWVTQ